MIAVPVCIGSSKPYAVIGVTYPSGSTCTCTNGNKTLTAKDTSGKAIFVIPSAGTWMVKAVKGSQSASKAVSITTEGQVKAVELTYVLIIIDGTTCRSDFQPTFYQAGSNTGTWEPSTDCYLYVSPEDGYGIVQGKYDLTKYNGLKITLKSTSGAAYKGMKWIGVNDTSATATNPAANIAKTTIPTSATDITYTVDISNVTGEQYINLVGTADSGSVRYKITKLWLE